MPDGSKDNNENRAPESGPQPPAWLIASAAVINDFNLVAGQSTPQAIEVQVSPDNQIVGKTEIPRT